MPAYPRSKIIDNNQVGTYHVYNRCVRQAFLLGNDEQSQKNYEHRKQWIADLLIKMAAIFAIDIFKYALQDNHFHLILRNRPDIVRRWNDIQVLRRAMQAFPKKFERMGLYVKPNEKLPKQLLKNQQLIGEMRKRLSSISWLMKIVQERIAKQANLEDGVKGAFWAGRFRSKALLDSAAVFACSIYVDLNLIHSGKCSTPEKSKYTSAYDRIRGLKARMKKRRDLGVQCDGFLAPLNTRGDYPGEDLAVKEVRRASNEGILELALVKYLELLDVLGRVIRRGKRGAIPQQLRPLIERLGINPDFFFECVEACGSDRGIALGSAEQLQERAKRRGGHWLQGIGNARKFFIGSTSSDN